MDFFIAMFRDGGFMMNVIALLLLIAIVIIIERFIYLFFRANLNAQKFMNRVFSLYKEKKINEALSFCNKTNKPLARIIEAAIKNHESMDRDIQDSVDETFLAEAPALKRLTPLLSVISQIATILGLLGTIIGLMEAFSALSGIDPAIRTETLSNGIAKAMSTTAFGLIVAGITIFFFAVINAKIEAIIDDIDENSVKIINFIKKYRSN